MKILRLLLLSALLPGFASCKSSHAAHNARVRARIHAYAVAAARREAAGLRCSAADASEVDRARYRTALAEASQLAGEVRKNSDSYPDPELSIARADADAILRAHLEAGEDKAGKPLPFAETRVSTTRTEAVEWMAFSDARLAALRNAKTARDAKMTLATWHATPAARTDAEEALRKSGESEAALIARMNAMRDRVATQLDAGEAAQLPDEDHTEMERFISYLDLTDAMEDEAFIRGLYRESRTSREAVIEAVANTKSAADKIAGLDGKLATLRSGLSPDLSGSSAAYPLPVLDQAVGR